MLRALFISACLLVGATTTHLFAQTDSSATFEENYRNVDTLGPQDPNDFVFKPTVGLGTGMFTFFGDVGYNYKGYHPLVSRIGYDLTVNNPLTNWLDLGFYVIFGKISASERGPDRNLNFESRIRTGGAVLSYNFRHLLPEKHKVQPYFFTGFESFEFLSKTDLYDQYGNFYHYWSDGSIRSMDENDPNAVNAAIIHRDYNYESDLREQNIDGFGKYRERSWSIPIGAGIQFIMGERMKLKLGTSLHLTFTDLVDNVSAESIGSRQGNKANDKFLYSSVSVSYDLLPIQADKKEKLPIDFGDESLDEIFVMDMSDADKDGVRDMEDECQNTPEGVAVDVKGCPLDEDRDLVKDYLDDERPTPAGNFVDEKGVTLTDEEIYRRYLCYKDSTFSCYKGELQFEEIIVNAPDGMGGDAILPKGKHTYYVVMGTEKKQVVSSELYKYLGFKDFRTIESGDTVFYVMGKYNNITDAVNREKDLKDKGFTSDGIIQQDNKDKTVNTLDKNEINALLNAEKDSSGTTALTNTNYVQPFYRVQIGAYSKRLPANVFKDVPNLVYVTGEDGVTRYYSGYFTDLKSAADHRVDLYGMGYKKSFIAAFKDGKRVTLQDAGATLVDPNNPDVIDKNDVLTNKVEAKDVKFKINLGEYSSDVPAEVLDVFLEIGNVTPRRSKTGKIMYVTGEYSTFEEAEKVRKTLAARGIANAALVGEFKGRIITADEAKTLLGK